MSNVGGISFNLETMRTILAIFTMELRRIFAYRMAFWFRTIGTIVVPFASAWFLWHSIFSYSQKTEVGGFSLPQIIFYYFLVPLINDIANPDDQGKIAEEIYDGALTKYLLYPIHYIIFQYTTFSALIFIGIIQILIALGIYALIYPSIVMALTFNNLMLCLGFCCLASILSFLLSFMVQMAAFWIDIVWSLRVMQKFITAFLGGILLPLSLFPVFIENTLSFLPFPYLVWFPIKILQDKVTHQQILFGAGISILWIIILGFLCRKIWNKGKYCYTGVGI